jgi:hypothetical protein
VIGMLSRPDIARLIVARIHLAPFEFVPTEHETEMLASAFAAFEQFRNRVVLEAEESDETETCSLLVQLRTARTRAKAWEKTADQSSGSSRNARERRSEAKRQILGGADHQCDPISRRAGDRAAYVPGRADGRVAEPAMTAQPELLVLWRTAAPTKLLADRELPGRLRAFLASRLEPRDADEKRLLDGVLRGDGQATNATFVLAGTLWSRFHPPADYAMTWTLLAALYDHEPAALAIAQGLLAHAEHLEQLGRQSFNEKDDRQALKREAARVERLALAWCRAIRSPVVLRAYRWRHELAPPTFPTAGAQEATSKEEPPAASPALQVIAEVGFPETEEASIVDAYEMFTKPLPLRGGWVNPDTLRTALSLEFPHMMEAADRIADDLELLRRAGVPWARFRPLLLVGPPGTGKTRFARRVARLLGTGHGEISVGGVSDNRLVEGTARGWRNAQPCWPLLVMRQSGAANPILVVDEIDKAVGSHNGDVKATLLGMLEIETARTWFDACLPQISAKSRGF